MYSYSLQIPCLWPQCSEDTAADTLWLYGREAIVEKERKRYRGEKGNFNGAISGSAHLLRVAARAQELHISIPLNTAILWMTFWRDF